MAKGQMIGMPPLPQTERPSVVKDSELRSLDEHKEDADNGWAGTHEEVDYSAKLQFDESDDSEDDASSQTSKKKEPPKSQADNVKEDKVLILSYYINMFLLDLASARSYEMLRQSPRRSHVHYEII